MRKLSTNMEEVLQCLTNDYVKFGDICEKYGRLQEALHNYNPKSYIWKSLVNRVLNVLIKHKLVEHGARGEYRKAQQASSYKSEIAEIGKEIEMQYNAKMFLFARWISVNYSGTVLNESSGYWWREQLKCFNDVAYLNYVKSGAAKETKEFLKDI